MLAFATRNLQLATRNLQLATRNLQLALYLAPIQAVRLNEPPPQISYENEIIWSHWDQIISFSWDI